MTPEQYAEKRIFILENAVRNLMATLSAASPAIAVHIDMVGREWDRELDRLDSERAWANAAQSAAAVQVDAKEGGNV